MPCRLLSCSDFLCIHEHFARLSLAKPLQNEGPSVSGRVFSTLFWLFVFRLQLRFLQSMNLHRLLSHKLYK